MPKAAIEADRIARLRRGCEKLEQLQDETWRLCGSITAKARCGRSATRARTRAKAVPPQLRRAKASE